MNQRGSLPAPPPPRPSLLRINQVVHPFRVIKRQFGYRMVRYPGLAKNAAQVLTLFALSNLWMKPQDLIGNGRIGAPDRR